MLKRYGLYCYRKQSLKTLLLVALLAMFILIVSVRNYSADWRRSSFSSRKLKSHHRIFIYANYTESSERNSRCNYFNCFNSYKCGKNGQQKIQVYVYPFKEYYHENGHPVFKRMSKEFWTIMRTIMRSTYYTSDPNEACIFVPSIDTLSQDNFAVKETSQVLASLQFWNNGENHILFNFIPEKHSSVIELPTGNAIIAGAGFDSWTYRTSFDISLPAYNPYSSLASGTVNNKRLWLVVSPQLNVHYVFKEKLKLLTRHHHQLVVMTSCSTNVDMSVRCHNNVTYSYPNLLQKSTFCIVLRGTRLFQPILLEVMAAGCIPVIISDTLVMPFQEIIDWKRVALFVPEDNIESVMSLVKSVSDSRVREMSTQCLWLYNKYFNSIESITNTTLEILNQRVFPEISKFYEDWNLRPNLAGAHTPLFSRTKAAQSPGFTAVVLTYDRVESLFFLVEKLALVPSLTMILIVWNNPNKLPPDDYKWPNVSKPLKVIRTMENKLSNRFLPYKEIETEAVLSLDDDISMLTEDELDFGFEVWREFPDRIVGFPSRTHVWDKITQSWKYESEWKNEISMVLTGAAFYHKYWNYVYSTMMPKEIKTWVDDRMNCEDIAMNFLVSNVTNKAPMKVTPRKKFKCPQCTNVEMLSADLQHMVERSNCINKFAKIYGKMPLKKVEFRADPVLYKDSFPSKLKRFKNIGDL